ncbi:MAG: ABC transporter ATP-binding protein [Eubacteriales bacterium]|nr:ABC transporter ATP-binding protein [Eubacteriales bacterium]MDY3332642.1 ABC transporter ATP-binding protein [Gallibacter sp.]
MDNIVEVQGLKKNYDNFKLSDISFTIPKGCVAGLIGLNGQGKTTTIRLMLGLSPKDAGEIKIFDKDMEVSSKEIKENIGVVFDEDALYSSLKMKDMKSIVARAYNNWDDNKYYELMNKFDLDESQVIDTLSKGMKMKFSLVLALSHHARFLIMDEPTSGLDPLVRKQLLDILKDYMLEDGEAILYSTHITSDLDKFADVIIFIDKGRILFVEEKDVLLDTHIIVKGDSKYITDENKGLFLNLTINKYGFSGVTKNVEALKKTIPDIICEKVNIEDLMVAYIEGGKKDA